MAHALDRRCWVGQDLAVRRTLILFGCAVLSFLATPCQAQPTVRRVAAPATVRSLGATNVHFEVRAAAGDSVSLPLSLSKVRWLLVPTLRIAIWDPRIGQYHILNDSRYDPQAQHMNGVAARAGTFTVSVFGMSRLAPEFVAQRELSRFKAATRDFSRPFGWPDCRQILCPADSALQSWRQELRLAGLVGLADSLSVRSAGACHHCDLVFSPGDFPETGIVLDPHYECADRHEINIGPEEVSLFTGPKSLVSLDGDADGLTIVQEYCFGTSDLMADTDGDGLEDGWEALGYDADGDGVREIDLPAMGVSPVHKDILVEIDWMRIDGVDEHLEPLPEALQGAIDAFAAIPVSNPDGVDGINLIIDKSDRFDAAANDFIGIVDSETTMFTEQYTDLKNALASPVTKAGISRYCLFIDRCRPSSPAGYTESIPGPNFLVSLGGSDVTSETVFRQLGIFMHELGHTLGLEHGGFASPVPDPVICTDFDTYQAIYKPNYPSVMNYHHATLGVEGVWKWVTSVDAFPEGEDVECTLPVTEENLDFYKGILCFFVETGGTRTYAFSEGKMSSVNETSMDESEGMPPQIPSAVNWDNGAPFPDPDPVQINLNSDWCRCVDTDGCDLYDILEDHDDLGSLIYKVW